METHAPNGAKTSFIDLFLRSIAVLGLIAVLLLGAWGIIQLAVAIPNLFSGKSLFNSTVQKETLVVSLPASVTSGQTLQLSWVHNNPEKSAQYSYAISYACQNGLTLGAPVPTGSYQTVACNTPFNYVNATEHMSVVPVLTSTSPVQVVFTITATKLATGAVTSTGSGTITIAPSAAPAAKPAATTPVKKPAATKAKSSTTYYPAATRSALYGYPDLAVNIVSVVPNGSRTTVQFVVANVGTNTVNSGWSFNATLPINGAYTFASQPQQALYPGDHIVYNLSFDNTFAGQNNYYYSGTSGYNVSGYTCNGYNCVPPSNYYNNYPYNNQGYQVGTVTITADPLNYITETNKGNNSATVTTPVY